MSNWTSMVVWASLGLNVITTVLLVYYIRKMRQYKQPSDRNQEILDAISAERQHFGNIESFWNGKWRVLREQVSELERKIARFFNGSPH